MLSVWCLQPSLQKGTDGRLGEGGAGPCFLSSDALLLLSTATFSSQGAPVRAGWFPHWALPHLQRLET